MFYSDKPIQSGKDDQLGRSSFAKLLAQSLLNLNTSDTFSIGLFGKWGSGKTSIVNMMLKEIEEQQQKVEKDEKLVVVRFEPWNFSDTNQLLTQFFIRLSNELRSNGDKKLAQIGEALEQYSDAFELVETIPVVGGLLALLGKSGVTAIGKKMKKGADEKDILKQKEFIIDLLMKQSSKILVVIDDIDRLSDEQIRQVFQLITSVAKFPQTVYLLVFDKDIVVKALEKVQEGSGEDYLEKIIQMPIQIPNIQSSKLKQVLINQLNKILSECEDVSFNQTHWRRLYETCVVPFVNSLRDVNRLCNSVQFKLTSISSEVDFTDMVAISALEIRFPQVYEWVKDNKSVLTGGIDWTSLGGREKTQKEWYDFYHLQIQTELQKTNSSISDENAVKAVMAFLSTLFPSFGQKIGKIYETYDPNAFRRNNQIAHSEKFDRYFNLDIENIGFRKTEILSAVYTFSVEEFREFLLEQERKNKSYEFLEEVRAMIPEISSERSKIMVHALVRTSENLDTVSPKSFLSISTNSFAEHIVVELMDKIEINERLPFFF